MEQFQTEASVEEPRTGKQARQFLLDVFETVVISILLFVAINAVSARIRVDGHSMVPTFQDGEFVIVDKISYSFKDPERGEIVVFHYPRDPEQEYIKRIIGLPGEEITVQDGIVAVNGEVLAETYISAAPSYELDLVVPEGEYFVLGDNRNNSSDSHNWGTVPTDYLVGRAIFVYWPLNELGLIKDASAADAAQE